MRSLELPAHGGPSRSTDGLTVPQARGPPWASWLRPGVVRPGSWRLLGEPLSFPTTGTNPGGLFCRRAAEWRPAGPLVPAAGRRPRTRRRFLGTAPCLRLVEDVTVCTYVRLLEAHADTGGPGPVPPSAAWTQRAAHGPPPRPIEAVTAPAACWPAAASCAPGLREHRAFPAAAPRGRTRAALCARRPLPWFPPRAGLGPVGPPVAVGGIGLCLLTFLPPSPGPGSSAHGASQPCAPPGRRAAWLGELVVSPPPRVLPGATPVLGPCGCLWGQRTAPLAPPVSLRRGGTRNPGRAAGLAPAGFRSRQRLLLPRAAHHCVLPLCSRARL